LAILLLPRAVFPRFGANSGSLPAFAQAWLEFVRTSLPAAMFAMLAQDCFRPSFDFGLFDLDRRSAFALLMIRMMTK
jgi:hypothetical protein